MRNREEQEMTAANRGVSAGGRMLTYPGGVIPSSMARPPARQMRLPPPPVSQVPTGRALPYQGGIFSSMHRPPARQMRLPPPPVQIVSGDEGKKKSSGDTDWPLYAGIGMAAVGLSVLGYAAYLWKTRK